MFIDVIRNSQLKDKCTSYWAYISIFLFTSSSILNWQKNKFGYCIKVITRVEDTHIRIFETIF